MKTKAFLLVCLFVGIGLTQVSAQPTSKGENVTGTVTYVSEYGEWTVPVWCGGEISDYVTCPNLVLKEIVHFERGEIKWIINKVESTEWTSLNKPEVVYKGVAMFDHVTLQKDYATSQMHLIGYNGEIIMCKLKFDTQTWKIFDIQFNCH